MIPKLFLALFLVTLSLHQATAAIDEEDIHNANKELILRVYEENKLRFYNLHRAKKPSLKLSLHGSTIEKIVKKNDSFWTLVLDDNSTLDISSQEWKNNNVTQFYLRWHGSGTAAAAESREICFYYSYNHANWYGAYQSPNATWPMTTTRSLSKQQFNYLMDANTAQPVAEPREHLLILEQLYLNSDGYALLVDDQSPLFIRRSTNGEDPVMCFSVNNSAPYTNERTVDLSSYLDIKMHILVAPDIKIATQHVVHESGLIPKPTKLPDTSIMSFLTWFQSILNYSVSRTSTFIGELQTNFMAKNYTLIMAHYNGSYLENLLSQSSFPEESLMLALNRSGYHSGLGVTRPDTQRHASIADYLVGSTNYFDFSHPEAARLYFAELEYFKLSKQLHTFIFEASNVLLTNYSFHDPLVRKYPSLFTTKYLETVSKLEGSIISEYAFRSQHLPIWTRLTNYAQTLPEQLLAELIPNVLSASVAGYSYLMPYTAGGFNPYRMPSEELYLRMVQAITFMPAMSFGKKPWDYSSRALAVTKKYVALHLDYVPAMIKLMEKRITTGEPVLRPMWWAEPEDTRALKCNDQYMLGEDVVVAPILAEKKYERMVYLPSGVWMDVRGKEFTGPTEINVVAPLEELPYFRRKK